MSKKRTATSELNHDNWNMEEEPEEMGTYKRASASDLKMRPMKRAKRRGITGDNDGPSVFKNFKAFGTADSSMTPTFSFLSSDGDKPKLSIGGSFPSFSFGKSVDSNKVDKTKANVSQSENSTSVSSSTLATTVKNNIDKKENESSSKPVFEFVVTDVSKSTSSDEPLKSTFSFGGSANTSTDKPISSSFNFKSSEKESMDKNNVESSPKPIFSFGLTNTTKSNISVESSPKPTFSFGVPSSNKNGDKTILSGFNFNPSKPGGESSPAFKFGINDHSSSPSVTSQQSKQSSDSPSRSTEPQSSKINGISNSPKTEKKKSTLFLANLKSLNLGVMKWVQQHLDKNQYINLIPIFEDYKSHFEDIKKRYDNDDTQQTKSNKIISSRQVKESSSALKNSSSSDEPVLAFGTSSTTGNKTDPSPSVSAFGEQKKTASEEDKISDQKPFTFGVNKTSSENSEANSESTSKAPGLVFNFGKSTSNPTFSFGLDKSKPSFKFGSDDNGSSSNTSGFSFGTSKDNKPSGFSFATSTESKPSQESKDENEVGEQEEEEQMPEIKEEDSVYDKKVKLFYKKGSQYDTIGVGTLYIKPIKDKEKSQLVVRADNNIGTVLLNIVLNDSIPTQRIGKNNVLIACIPNPPLANTDPKAPASILIRVKEEKDADEMLEKLNHYKNSQKSDDDSGDSTN
ncbi:UNVERIFIED_CONTAM: hypothetical protein RMT77_009862 [Armadillidium vulgare]